MYPIQIGKEKGIEFDTEPFFFFNGNLPDKEEMLKLEILMVSVSKLQFSIYSKFRSYSLIH